MGSFLLVVCLVLFPSLVFAGEAQVADISLVISDFLNYLFAPIVSFLAFIFLGGEYEIFGGVRKITVFGLPVLVAWLITGAVFFTFKLRFINVRLFSHAIAVVRGKFKEEDAPGKVTPLQALFTAVSATVGLGNIAGVAIAISIGGPGAVLWMMFAAFFAMSLKFSEVLLGQKYRIFNKDGHLLSGSFYYLEQGLKDKGRAGLGKFLGVVAAYSCVLGAIGAGLMFQANQAVAILADSFSLGGMSKFILVVALAGSIALILIGGVTRVASVAGKVVPLMAVTYVLSCVVVLIVNLEQVPDAVNLMFYSAFQENALYGGIIGAIIQGFKRAAFSNEAGLGSAPIAHAAAKTREPVREGAVALLEPFIDTIVICFMTGIVIVVTGVYQNTGGESGVILTKNAFATVSNWFPYILSVVVFLFAFSTMLTYSYYGSQAWGYIAKKSSKTKFIACDVTFAVAIFVGGMLNLGAVIDFADILFLSMAVPNIIGLYILRNDIRDDAAKYVFRLKSGEFSED
jgi:AGCS family alanine or glycine:cation symporter